MNILLMVSFLLLPRASYFYSSTFNFLGSSKKETHNRSQKADAECGQYKPTGSFFPVCPGRIDLPAGEHRICISLYTVHLLLSDNENVSQCAIIVCSTNYLMVKKCQGINGRRGAHRIRKTHSTNI